MSRNKYILYIALVLLVVLVVAFAGQIRRLQKQVRSSVRIIPGESKSRDDVAQNQLDRDAATPSARPEVTGKVSRRSFRGRDCSNHVTLQRSRSG